MYQTLIRRAGLMVVALLFCLTATVYTAQAAPLAATVTVDLCASNGTLLLPDGAIVPVWGFVQTTTCAPGLVTTFPGPEIRVNSGDTLIINLRNALNVPTSLLVPGQIVNGSGGVVGTFTREAAPNGMATYTISSAEPGTYLYESGTDSDIQVAMGLYGALIVAQGGAPYNGIDQEAVLVLSEIDPALNANPAGFNMRAYAPRYWLINGKAYPNTTEIGVGAGDTLLLRYLNAGSHHHTMAALGAHQTIIAKEGFILANAYQMVAEAIPAGQTMDTKMTIPNSGSVRIPLYNRNMYLTNNGAGPGGMFTVITTNPATPQNGAPQVNAGTDMAITLPTDSINLSATATDDGLPNGTVSMVWSQVGGPTGVTFAPATGANTTATFPQPGVYTLQIAASDGALTGSDQVVVTVNPPATGNLFGDCNGDAVVNAADISATVLELFDGDGIFWLNAPGGTFPGNFQCDSNADATINAADVSCAVLQVFAVPNACQAVVAGRAQSSVAAQLALPGQAVTSAAGQIAVPVQLTTNGHAISSVAIELHYDAAQLTLDHTDGDQDGVPDAVALQLPATMGQAQTVVRVDATTGTLQILITDVAAAPATLPDGPLATVTFDLVGEKASGNIDSRLTLDEATSLGSAAGQAVPLQSVDGLLRIEAPATQLYLPVIVK